MQPIYEFFQLLGSLSIDLFWFPLLIWSVVAFIAFIALKYATFLNPLYQYHLRLATLAAIPFGFLAIFIIHQLRQSTLSQGTFEGAIFVVQSPIELTVSTQSSTSFFQPDFLNPNFLIGTITFLTLVISLFFLTRLILSYFSLRRLHQTLETSPLEGFETSNKEIQLAFHDHPLVPFTFGWLKPVIVLPKKIQDQPEKVEMAIQHELVHIERGDYLFQLFLSVIESVLWFHPLVQFGTKEIETYREISCDQQVLSTTQVSTKKYASMLYELVPLERGLSGFSVNMAIKQSTLKQRIQIMKRHKLYKTSIKRSILFFISMTLLITLPIACSDLRGPEGLSPEELENISLNMENITMEINGKQIVTQEPGAGVTSTGLSAIFINSGEYGVFKISPIKFDEGKLAGEFVGNTAKFYINEMEVEITSDVNFLPGISEAELWVAHKADVVKGFSHGVSSASKTIDEYIGNMSKLYPSSSTTKGDGDYFVVVEKMPKLVGGLASIQSKIEYPKMAKRAGIEGRVTVQFIVNENGEVENPKIIKGIGGGCDEAALEAVKQARFEPGLQKGEPVRVQYSLPIIFRLNNSDFSNSGETKKIQPSPDIKMGDLQDKIEKVKN